MPARSRSSRCRARRSARDARSRFRPAGAVGGAAGGRERRWSRASGRGAIGVTLLEGVTGSGKTEVYFEAVAEAIRLRPPEPDPDAGDRADGAVHRPVRGPLRRAAGAVAFGRDRRAGASGCRRRSPQARRRWWPARARRCSCPIAISA